MPPIPDCPIYQIRKRDGRVVPFDRSKIEKAVAKAARAVGEVRVPAREPRSDGNGAGNGVAPGWAAGIAAQVTDLLVARFGPESTPEVEQIQDVVEEVLIGAGHPAIAKAYILYRGQRSQIRATEHILLDGAALMDDYLQKLDWRVSENSNMNYSLQGLNFYVASSISARYWLNRIYPPQVRQAHTEGAMHIHDLSVLAAYCCGWDLQDLLMRGFGGVPAKVESRPPRHLRSALGQLVNFFYTLQGETAGAQAFSNFDTLLAPFIAYDELDYKGVKQAVQEFVYNINVPTRVGFQTPFTNCTMDLICPHTLYDQAVVIGGEMQDRTYGEFQHEMDLINRAFAEVMLEGDAKGRVFTFPIPTYNITADFDWENDDLQPLWEITAKYGIPYFANYVNSDMQPEDARSMCCRLRLDNRELRKRGGGLFAASPLTGSVGVVTLNMPRIGYLSANEDEFFARLGNLMDTAQVSLEIKRKTLERLTEQGLYPYSRHYLGGVKEQNGVYWGNHFSTIGLNGMSEACLNFLGVDIGHPTGKAFALRVLDFMLEKIRAYQEETNTLYNLEASPAEGAAYRLARADVERYPDGVRGPSASKGTTGIITAGTREAPYYTNSTHLPVNYTDDLWATLAHQDELQTRYTGGTVLHIFLGERLDDWRQARLLVRRIAENFHLPYYTLTPTFSICPVHGYIPGEHPFCPYEHSKDQLEQLGLTIAYESQPTQVPTVAG